MEWVNVAAIGLALVCAVPLAVADVRFHRLPNQLTAVLFLGELILLASGAVALAAWAELARALSGALLMALAYAACALLDGGPGCGDIKLAASIGLVTAWWGWESWLLALLCAVLIGGLASVIRLFRGRSLNEHLAFGPPMLLGWALAAVAALA